MEKSNTFIHQENLGLRDLQHGFRREKDHGLSRGKRSKLCTEREEKGAAVL